MSPLPAGRAPSGPGAPSPDEPAPQPARRGPTPLVRRPGSRAGSGHGGDRVLAQITGLDEQTIRRGRAELAAGLADAPAGRVRRPGGGRPPVEKKIPAILTALEALVEPETAGDPMSEQKWVRSSLRAPEPAAGRGRAPGQPPDRRAAAEGTWTYSLHVNAKRVEARAQPSRPRRPVRVHRRAAAGLPGGRAAGHQRRHQEEGADRQLQERRAGLEPGGRGGQRPRLPRRRARPGGALRHLRPDGQPGHGLRRAVGRHARVRRRGDRPLVGGRGPRRPTRGPTGC